MTKYVLALFSIVLIFAGIADAQTAATPEIGANPYKSYSGGDFDHIQMQNGSLYLRIPLLSFPQKGKLSLSFSLLGNGPSYKEVAACDPLGDCSYTYENVAPGACGGFTGELGSSDQAAGGTGVSGVSLVMDQSLAVGGCTYATLVFQGKGACPTGDCTVITGEDAEERDYQADLAFFNIFGISDSSGAYHELGFDQSNWTRLQANDGTGYQVTTPYVTSGLSAVNADLISGIYNMNGSVIYEPSGIRHLYQYVSGSNGSSTETLQDPAGNQIISSFSSTSSVITDSVGRQIPNISPMMMGDATVSPSCPTIAGVAAAYSGTWTVPGYGGQPAVYHFCYANINVATNFFGLGPMTTTQCFPATDPAGDVYCQYLTWEETVGTFQALQSVVLPDGTYWGFTYDSAATANQVSYGDLKSVILPSGGSINYTYTNIDVCGVYDGEEAPPLGRAIQSRTLNPLVGLAVVRTYAYKLPQTLTGPAETVETDSLGNDIAHIFTLDHPGTNQCGADETATRWYDGSESAGRLLKEVDTSFLHVTDPQAGPVMGSLLDVSQYSVVERLPAVQTTYLNAVVQGVTHYGYDSLFTNVQPYTVSSSGPPSETNNSTFSLSLLESGVFWATPTLVDDGIGATKTTRYAASNPAYQTAGMLSLPKTVSRLDENGQASAQIVYGYDELGSPQGTYGNLTSITTAPGIESTTQYNASAMPIQKTDPNGNAGASGHATFYSYDSSGLYVTSVERPSTNGISHQSFYMQDFNTGLATAISDENASGITDLNHVTTYAYDIMGRLTRINYPDGGMVTQCYTDTGGATCSLNGAPYKVITQKRQDTSVTLSSSVSFDGLGRVTEKTDASNAMVDTTYDSRGHIASVSNPHFAQPSLTDGVTSYSYDAVGRMAIQCQQDNGASDVVSCVPQRSYLSWTYNGNVTTVTDEAHKAHANTVDARGRLVSVTEPNGALTNYVYDVLDNLSSVNHVGVSGETPRIRTFTYDSLSRLTAACNPETIPAGQSCDGTHWSDTYAYDANGNMRSRTDARGVVLSYTYDALNRPTSKHSSDGTVSDDYYYDQTGLGPNQIGRLGVADHYNVASSGFYYDAMGRIVATSYAAPGSNGWQGGMGVVYDLAGNPIQINYPDGRVVTQTFDAAGRLAKVSSGGTDYISGTANGGIAYTPTGAVDSFTLGNGVSMANKYNDRLQPCLSSAITPILPAPSSPAVGNLFERAAYYQPSSTSNCGHEAGNNGNIYAITDNRIPGWSQGFDYDSLNRLTSAQRSDGGYNHTYHYDSFGNLNVQDNLASASSVLLQANSQNRLMRSHDNGVTWGDNTYDASGNLTAVSDGINPTRTYQYNALSQLVSIDGGSVAAYYYNGMDERAFKQTATGWTDYIYLNGQPMSEHNSDGTWSDYIYANGQKIAKVDSQKPILHAHGVRDASTYMGCGTGTTNVVGANAAINNQPILDGDTLVADIRQTNSQSQTVTTFGVMFSDGGGTGLATDKITGDYLWMYSQSDGAWHHVVVDLSSYAAHGGTPAEVMTTVTVATHAATGYGTWDTWIANMAVVRKDGSVLPIYTGQNVSAPDLPSTACGGNSLTLATELTPTSDIKVSTNYYLDDHLGTAQMELSQGGWPVWQGQFTPFGQELPDGQTAMHYKFTGKERDAESGLDYFGARYYASNFGRWMSPDWAAKAQPVPYAKLDNPQSLNLYGYVLNNPLSKIDADGHDLTVTGDKQKDYIAYAQKASGLTLAADKNGKISITASPKDMTALGKSFTKLINDTENHVSISAEGATPKAFIGQFDGNGHQTLNFQNINALDGKGGFSGAAAVTHETFEAYASSQGMGFGASHANGLSYEGAERTQEGAPARTSQDSMSPIPGGQHFTLGYSGTSVSGDYHTATGVIDNVTQQKVDQKQ